MELARTEDQEQLAAVVRSLLDKRSNSGAVRAAMESGSGYDEGLWQALCGQVGVASLPIPEEYDGVGASFVETAIVLEELGRNLAPAPLLTSAIATAALLLHGSQEQRADLLPRIAAGEVVALATGDLVVDGAAATAVLGLDGDGLRVLDQDTGVVGSLDPTLRLASLDGAPGLPTDHPVYAVAAALTSALQVGCAQRGLDMTVAYSKERVQFGRPIGSFQALKHRMADMLVLLETSRSASWGATAAVAAYVARPDHHHREQLLRRAAVARSYCTDALADVAAETLQLHGGIAITWEHDAQLVFKRAHALNRLWEPPHRARARLLPH